LGVLGCLLAACDRLGDDLHTYSGVQESIIQLPQDTYRMTPGGQVLIDLLEGIRTSEEVSLSITIPPGAGEATISQGRYIHYRSTSQQPLSDFFVLQVANGNTTWDADTISIDATAEAEDCSDALFYSNAEGTTEDDQLSISLPIPSEPSNCYPWLNAPNFEVEILNEDDIAGTVLFSNQAFRYFPPQNVGAFSTQVLYIARIPGDSELYYGALEIFIGQGDPCENDINADIFRLSEIDEGDFPATRTFNVSSLMANDQYCIIPDPSGVSLTLLQRNFTYSIQVVSQNNSIIVTADSANFIGIEPIDYILDAPEWEESITGSISVEGKLSSGERGQGTDCSVFAGDDQYKLPANVVTPGGGFGETRIRLDILDNDRYCAELGTTAFVISEGPTFGTVNSLGFGIEYIRPKNGDTSTDTFTYRLCSGDDCYEATVTIAIE